MTVVNAYNLSPDDVASGQEMLFVIKAIVTPFGYRLYRCEFPYQEGDAVPQGSRVYDNESEIAEVIFPVLGRAGLEPDRM